jgi:hypothetical protein
MAVVRLYIPIIFCLVCTTVVILSAMDRIPVDMIVEIVGVPNFEKLSKIIRASNSPLMLNIEVRDALFPAYSLLLTCKKYYTINKEHLQNISVAHLYEFLPSRIAIFLFPKTIRYSMVEKYYPHTARDLIKVLLSQDLVNHPEMIQKNMGDMNGNTIIHDKGPLTFKLSMLLERITGCIENFMKNNRSYLNFLNGIAVLNHLCMQEQTDLSLYGISDCNKKLAQHLYDICDVKGRHIVFGSLLPEVREKIEAVCNVKENSSLGVFESPRSVEQKSMINDLVGAYLYPLPGQGSIIKHIE